MNSLNDIWQEIIKILSTQLTATAIDTWFSDCEPVEIDDCRLVVHTTTDFKRSIIINRFGETIRNALSDLFSCDFDLTVLAGDELGEYQAGKLAESEDNALPEMAGYTFDRFIVGNSNKFAHAAAIAVSEKPGQAYNPLFIYGNSGLGKTHLLLAIGQAIHERDATKKLAYIKGDDFTNQMVKSIKDGTVEDFRLKYRNVDLFLVDDIQFIAGKRSTQEEFFHTFNTLYESGRQIVLTSDRPPSEMTQLEDRLRTRFEWGLLVDVAPPDFETRLAIVKNKAALLGMELPDKISAYIAENVTANVRQLEGTINKILAYKDLLGNDTDEETVTRAIQDMLRRSNEYVPTPEAILEYISKYYSLDESVIRGQQRVRDAVSARQIAMYLIRSMTNLSLDEIGKVFDNRDHSTVLYSIQQIEKKMKKDAAFAEMVKEIKTNINSKR